MTPPLYILALQTDSGRLYWGGMRDIGYDQGYRWQQNPHQACCFKTEAEASAYRVRIGHAAALVVDVEAETADWLSLPQRKDALHAALLARPVRATFLIAEQMSSDRVQHIKEIVQ